TNLFFNGKLDLLYIKSASSSSIFAFTPVLTSVGFIFLFLYISNTILNILGISTSSTACKSYPELCFVCLFGIIAFGSCFTFSKYLAILISLYVYLSTLCNSASCILFDNTFLAPENTCSALSILAFNFLYALINAVSMICSFIVCNSASCVLSAIVPVDSRYLLLNTSSVIAFALSDSIPRFSSPFTE